ncbi:Heat shock cognate 71 kDa protein [Orchesella cincta]|uniref:Heat shock cognate 71 kDa protein n=1 Tax=Orchesella cincta TaxID=48709 RepID=A0A1D2M9Q3_ORCCI|nr:Heat shock cognate 71 kDa protein [Orchesella cincta]
MNLVISYNSQHRAIQIGSATSLSFVVAINMAKPCSSGKELLLLVSSESSKNSSLKVNDENLKQILAKVGKRQISIISVVGQTRQHERRLLLGSIIRSLEACEAAKSNSPEKPFLSDQLPELDRAVTWIFHRPFILKDEDGHQFALLLLDTQGSQQDLLKGREMASLIGLNLHLSSTTIISSSKQLPENLISRVGTFINHGLLPNREEMGDDEKTPFQTLTFHIRDWNFPVDFPFGGTGGNKFLDMKLQIKPAQNKESKQSRQLIRNCFQSVDCYLTPFPGQPAIMPGFTGAVEKLDGQFVSSMNEFLSSLLNNAKTPNGKGLTGQCLKIRLESYIQLFNSGVVPTSLTFLSRSHTALSQSQSDVGLPDESNLDQTSPTNSAIPGDSQLVKTALDAYNGIWKKHQKKDTFSATETNLLKTHKLAEKKAFDTLRNSEDNAEDYEKQLKLELAERFVAIQKECTEKRQLMISKAASECLDEYKDGVMAAFPLDNGIFDERQFVKVSSQLIARLNDDFEEKLGDGDDNAAAAESFQKRLKAEEAKYLAINNEQKHCSKDFSKAELEVVLAEYEKKMRGLTNLDPFMDNKTLKIWHEESHQSALKQLKLKWEKTPNYQDLVNQLEHSLNELFDKIQTDHSKLQEKYSAETEELISSLELSYSNELRQELNGMCTNAELEALHSQRVTGFLHRFQQQCHYPRGNFLLICNLEILKEKLESVLANVLDEKTKSKKAQDEGIKMAMEEAWTFYNEEMGDHIHTHVFLEEDALDKANEDVVDQAFDMYFNLLKQKSIPQHLAPGRNVLEQKFAAAYVSLKKQNVQNRTITISQTKNLVSDCLKDYQDSMNEGMNTVRNIETLTSLHEEMMSQAISGLQDKCAKKDDPQFLQPYINELEREILETFEEVEEIFELKLSKESGATNAALNEARKFYNEEMKKHFENHDFIRPDRLETLHKDVSKEAIRKCCEAVTLLSEAQKLELKEALKQTFEKYKQENDMNLEVDPAIGIDLGTTYCCVAVYMKGKVRIIPNAIGKYTTPSYVAFSQDRAETVGEPAKNRAYENPENTVFDAKRIIGRKFNDPVLQGDIKLWPFSVVDDNGVPKVLVNGKKLHPEEIAAKILRELKADAEKFMQCEVKKAVITVPAYFTDGQRQATIDAGQMAGLQVLTILSEPTAGALAYKKQHTDDEKPRNVLIFDLGGGTFDVAVLKSSRGEIEILAVDGDTHLGGEDFDRNLMKYCAEQFKTQHDIDLLFGKESDIKQMRDQVRRRLKRLQGECERKKIELTSARRVTVTVDNMHGTTDLVVPVTRDTFEQLNATLFEKTIAVVESALVEAKMEKSEVDDIVLVGGSTRIPKIQRMLEDYFGGKALDCSINPDEAVAFGAALKAAYLNGKIAKESIDFTKIQDVTPMSLGVEIYGGGFSVIIPKSTKIPVKLKERYKTAHNNQTSVQITIYQGEDHIAVNNKHLGDFYLNGIPPNDAEVENIDVEMLINSQGILHVSAVCSSTGDKSAISVTENKQRIGRAAIKRYLEEAANDVRGAAA